MLQRGQICFQDLLPSSHDFPMICGCWKISILGTTEPIHSSTSWPYTCWIAIHWWSNLFRFLKGWFLHSWETGWRVESVTIPISGHIPGNLAPKSPYLTWGFRQVIGLPPVNSSKFHGDFPWNRPFSYWLFPFNLSKYRWDVPWHKPFFHSMFMGFSMTLTILFWVPYGNTLKHHTYSRKPGFLVNSFH